MLMPDRDGIFKKYHSARGREGVTRRFAIGTLSMLGAAAAAPVSAAVADTGDTPILRLYRKYMELRTESLMADDADMEDYYAAFDAIEAEIAFTPSTCMADFAAKMLVTHCDGDYSQLDKNDPVWVEARALVEGAA